MGCPSTLVHNAIEPILAQVRIILHEGHSSQLDPFRIPSGD